MIKTAVKTTVQKKKVTQFEKLMECVFFPNAKRLYGIF